MQQSAIHRSVFAAAVLAAVAGAGPAFAQVSCGATIKEKVTMSGDLTCVTNPGFTVGSGGTVNMNGHTLTACAGCVGIALGEQGAKLLNGTVIGSGSGSVGV